VAAKHQGDPHEFVFKTPEQAHEVFPVLANFLKDKNMVHRLQKYALTRRNSLSMTEADWDELLSFAEQQYVSATARALVWCQFQVRSGVVISFCVAC